MMIEFGSCKNLTNFGNVGLLDYTDLVWFGTRCGNESDQSCLYWWLNGIDDEDQHDDDNEDNNDDDSDDDDNGDDNDDDNKDNDDDNDDDDDSHPAPCNNRGSSVATLASPGISQMRLLCFIDNTSHRALVLDFVESTLLHRQHFTQSACFIFWRIYSASQTTTQPLMCDNHTRKI